MTPAETIQPNDDVLVPMDRRTLLAGAAALGVSAALGGCQTTRSLSLSTPAAIDAHCHVFNAADLSARNFIDIVTRRDYADEVPTPPVLAAGDRGLLDLLIDFLVGLIQDAAPSAADELAWLNAAALSAAPDMLDDDGYGPADRRLDRARIERSLRQFFGPGLTAAPDAEGRRQLLEKILRELGRSGLEATLQTRDDAWLRSLADEIYGDPNADDPDPDRAALSGVFSFGFVVRHIRWVIAFTKPRYKLVNRIRRLNAERGGTVRLFVPALVDYAYWLDEQPPSDLPAQVRVMERIGQLQTDVKVHGLVAFDPLRELHHRKDPARPSALAWVEDAVMNRGFIGSKLYPPMGFQPAGNQGLAFQAHAIAGFDPATFGTGLDAALDDLYGWSVANDVPIMAHANDSIAAGAGFAKRAHPDHWRPVLDRHPALRLNLAHFGGFDEAFDSDGNFLPGQLDSTWEWAIGRLLATGRYANLYADLSYLPGLLARRGRAQDRYRRTIDLLRDFIARFDPRVTRLLYGSDWIMLGREARSGHYFEAVAAALDDLGLQAPARQRLFRDNAARFLGLTPGGATRRRLEAYYAAHALDPSFLGQFDNLSV